MIQLSKETLKNIERSTGLSMEQMQTMSALEEQEYVKKRKSAPSKSICGRKYIRTFRDLERIQRMCMGK